MESQTPLKKDTLSQDAMDGNDNTTKSSHLDYQDDAFSGLQQATRVDVNHPSKGNKQNGSTSFCFGSPSKSPAVDLTDNVCAICDDGGQLLVCERDCLRSFHPTPQSGAHSYCQSLGFQSVHQYHVPQPFTCSNCKHHLHQCFVCGVVGYSEASEAAGPEVFQCCKATCGRYYHPKCVTSILYRNDASLAAVMAMNVTHGDTFICPLHECQICKGPEVGQVYDLQFAVCRRCPTAYHRRCMPGAIKFQGEAPLGIQARAWNGLLSNQILMYCMNHKIVPALGTPRRDHLLFPFVAQGEDATTPAKMLSAKTRGLGNLYTDSSDDDTNDETADAENRKDPTWEPLKETGKARKPNI